MVSGKLHEMVGPNSNRKDIIGLDEPFCDCAAPLYKDTPTEVLFVLTALQAVHVGISVFMQPPSFCFAVQRKSV